MTVERGQGGQMGGEAERASREQAGKAELGSWGEEGVTSSLNHASHNADPTTRLDAP